MIALRLSFWPPAFAGIEADARSSTQQLGKPITAHGYSELQGLPNIKRCLSVQMRTKQRPVSLLALRSATALGEMQRMWRLTRSMQKIPDRA